MARKMYLNMEKEVRKEKLVGGLSDELANEALRKLYVVNWFGIGQCGLYLFAYGLMWFFNQGYHDGSRPELLLSKCSLAIVISFILLGVTIAQQVMIGNADWAEDSQERVVCLLISSAIRELSQWLWVLILGIEISRLIFDTERLVYGALWIMMSVLELIFISFARGGRLTKRIVVRFVEIEDTEETENAENPGECLAIKEISDLPLSTHEV